MNRIFADIAYKTSCMNVPQETLYIADHLTRDSLGGCSGELGLYFRKDSARQILKQSFIEHPLSITMFKNHQDYNFEYNTTVCKELAVTYRGINHPVEGRLSVDGGTWKDVTGTDEVVQTIGLKDEGDYNLWEVAGFMCNDDKMASFHGFDLTISDGCIEFLPYWPTEWFDKCWIRLHMRYNEYNIVVTMNLMKCRENGYVGLVSKAHCFDYIDYTKG